jgi:SAM-dependent methyltransferase
MPELATSVPAAAPVRAPVTHARFLRSLTDAVCCLCEHDDAELVAVGEDFEYRSSPDIFPAVRCRGCGLIYLAARPQLADLSRIYPPAYHAYDFSHHRFGFAHDVRSRLEARRVLRYCRGLPEDARILDVGCGDGFHLRLLREYGEPSWRLEGVDANPRAVKAAEASGLAVHEGLLQHLHLPKATYDLVLLIQTLEHLDDPVGVLREARSLLKPGGRLVIVTDNTDTFDFRIFKGRHWGGYHFPRHWNLFNRATLRGLARKVEMDVEALEWSLSPVNWVYSLHNLLVDCGAPRWLVNRFGLAAPGSLALFTIVDAFCGLLGKGALIRATFRRPG